MAMPNSSYRSNQRFDLQTRRKGQSCFVLTLSPRLRAFLNKGIFDSRLNSDNSYWLYGIKKWIEHRAVCLNFHIGEPCTSAVCVLP